MHSKHQFDASPLPASPCRPHHCLWIYVHPVHHIPPSPTLCPSQTSLTSRTLICKPRLVPPKPSTFGKPSTMPRSTPLRPEIEPHHCCPWKQSQPASHVITKYATLLPHPSHLPRTATVHHQKHLVHAATSKIPMTTARTLPTLSTNMITGKHTDSMSCRHPRIVLRSSGLKVRRAQVSLRRVEWLKSLEYPKTELKSGKVMRLLW